MKIIGLTGGIGSGKSTAAQIFKSLNVPVYVADDEAKALMNRSKVIRRKLIALFGEKAYVNGELNRAYISSQVFNDKSLLQKINAIVHPKVATHFKRWLSRQEASYVIKEAAIIFENDLQDQYDKIITVVAPKQERIKRIMKRDGTNRQAVLSIMANQLSDEEKTKRSDFVIKNTTIEEMRKQVYTLDTVLREIS